MLTILNNMLREDLIENATFEQQWKVAEGNNHVALAGRAFQAEGTTTAEALGQQLARCVPRRASRLEQVSDRQLSGGDTLEGFWFFLRDGEPRGDFEERSDLIWLRVLEDCIGYCFENRLVGTDKNRPVKTQLQPSM